MWRLVLHAVPLWSFAWAARLKVGELRWWTAAAEGPASLSSSSAAAAASVVEVAAPAVEGQADGEAVLLSTREQGLSTAIDAAATAGEAKAASLNQESAEGVIKSLEENSTWNEKVDQSLCRHWNLRFWPQVNFLSQEVRRRVQALPEEPTPEQQDAMFEFTRKLGYLACQDLLDPRQGHSLPAYAEHVVPFWEELAKAPNTSLEVPKMDPWFARRETMIWGGGGCAWWFQMLACDLGYISEKLSGSKKSDPTCWHTLQWPYWNPDHPTGPDYFKMVYHNMDPDPLGYLECQEHPLTFDTLEEICAAYHVYAPGTPDLKWWSREDAQGQQHGLDVTKPPVQYEDVLKCNKKTGFDNRENWPEFPGFYSHIHPSEWGMF